ncbi:MAG: response regulator transcription factor [Pirellulaceae bacterium]|jgi:DNA-binding response OmpR family regulator
MDTAPAWKRDQRQPRVLIVDDDFEIIEAVRYALEEQGYEVLVARDGNQGLAMAEQVQPDLMLLDMMMPKRSGFLVLESLHRASLPPMRIIMMTANEGERHKAYAEMLGVDDYLRKPLAIDRLMASVRHWLEEPFTDTQAS